MTAPERPDPAALRRLLDAGTPRPWGSTPSLSGVMGWAAYRVERSDGDGSMPDWVGDVNYRRNADLIVAAVNALPALLDRLEAAEAALAFYGDPDTYAWPPPEPTPMGPGDPWQTRAQLDKGARARAALAGAGKGARP